MTNKEIEAYKKFMYDEKNIGNCKNCPENTGCSNWESKKPCGQQNCWVSVHCKED